ncbi:nucleotide sugar dehydrogenase [Chloroflexota bacterium]
MESRDSQYPTSTKNIIADPKQLLELKAHQHQKRGRKIVVVQGLGFVGVAVAAVVASARDEFGQARYFVVGVDLPTTDGNSKIENINRGECLFPSPDKELAHLISEAVFEEQNLYATHSILAYSFADVIIVAVNLDAKHNFEEQPQKIEVDLQGFIKALRSIGQHMNPDALVLIETTIPIGTSKKIALPILREERLKRNITKPPYFAHAYERVMPGPNYIDSIRNNWRTFAGIDEHSAIKVREFLSSFINVDYFPLWELNDTNASELAKLLENSYRATNIAFIHEWTLLAEQIGVNLFEVIESIRVRKNTHDNIRDPGLGVGGYCLPKDSLLAQWAANHLLGKDVTLTMTLKALHINQNMPLHTFDLCEELAGGHLEGKTIAVCGITYLPEVPDTRNSPAELLVDELIHAGADVLIHDPYISSWSERPHINVSPNLESCIKNADGIIFAIPHQIYLDLDAKELLNMTSNPPFIVDANNILTDEKAQLIIQSGCRLLGVGKGHWRKLGYHRAIK